MSFKIHIKFPLNDQRDGHPLIRIAICIYKYDCLCLRLLHTIRHESLLIDWPVETLLGMWFGYQLTRSLSLSVRSV